jgi:hypothetical protein
VGGAGGSTARRQVVRKATLMIASNEFLIYVWYEWIAQRFRLRCFISTDSVV